jgi:kynurenine formamidase
VTPDTEVGVADFEGWERTHGRIPDQAIVLLRTGWDARYGDRAAYLGTAQVGPGAIPELHFPGLAPAAAQWLVTERRVKAFGLDTPSLDRGQSTTFGAHVALASAEVPGFENLASLGDLPATGSFVIALPMKIAEGSGGPLRIVAFVPDGTGDGAPRT